MARIRPIVVNFGPLEAAASDYAETIEVLIKVTPCPVCNAPKGARCSDQTRWQPPSIHTDRERIARGILSRYSLLRHEIASGFGNDDRLMELALDRDVEFRDDLDYEEEGTVSKRTALEGQLDRILTEIDKLTIIGDDVYEDDTVLLIKYRHTPSSDEYSYVALKVGGRWYVTGYQNEGPRSWDRLIEFFHHGEITEMWQVTEWSQLI